MISDKARKPCAIMASVALLSSCTTWQGFGPTPPAIPKPSVTSGQVTALAADVGTDYASFVGVGYFNSYKACSDYFDALIQIQNQAKFASDVTTATGLATTTLVALRSNAQKAARLVAKYAAGFAFASTVIDKFDQRALMTAYPTETKTLILGGMLAYENANPASKARTPAEAASYVAGHAEMCTYSGISRFAKQALSNATPKTGQATTLTGRDQGYVAAIMASMGFSSVTPTIRQLALLEFYVNEKPAAWKDDTAHSNALLTELPTSIAAIFKSGANLVDPATLGKGPAWVLLKAFADTNEEMKSQLADIRAAWTKPVKSGVAPLDNGTPTTPDRLETDLVPQAAGRHEIRF